MRLRDFLHELQRRRVCRVAAVYAVAGWLIIQVAVATFPVLLLPEWLTLVVVVLTLISSGGRCSHSRHRLVRSVVGLMFAAACYPPADSVAQRLEYPSATRGSLVDAYHGVGVADPYRWLEEMTSPETVAFTTEQKQFTEQQLRSLPQRAAIQQRLEELSRIPDVPQPTRTYAGRVFSLERLPGKSRRTLFMRAAPDSAPRVVMEPSELDSSIRLGNFFVSPDARLIGFNYSRAGTDGGEALFVRSLLTGEDLPDTISGGSWMVWAPDGRGFFYSRRMEEGTREFDTGLFYHFMGTPQAEDRLLHRWTYEEGFWMEPQLSQDSRFLVTTLNGVGGGTNRVYAVDVSGSLEGDPANGVVRRLDDTTMAFRYRLIGTVGDTVYALTNHEAPTYRIIRMALSEPGAVWQTVVPESRHAIGHAVLAGGQLVVQYLVDVQSQLRRFSLAGEPLGEIRLSGVGHASPVAAPDGSGELYVNYVSFVVPRQMLRYSYATDQLLLSEPHQLPFDPEAYETRQVFYTSKDGTRVPMFVTARRGLVLDGSHPTMLSAYGGYGASSTPYFSASNVLWLEMGGVLASANIRGGGEYGEEWHRGGMLRNKQNSFDDFIAAAEYLIREGYTSPSKLGITGGSNGGLLVGAVLTQRPDLFAVGIPHAGHYDMLRYHNFTNARAWIPEYGSSDDPEQFAYLHAYSPLHNVRPGTCYPATLIVARDQDDRVVPIHSYKFVAALQAAQSCGRPILLRMGVGSHGYAPPEALREEHADVWAFAAAHLGAMLSNPAPMPLQK